MKRKNGIGKWVHHSRNLRNLHFIHGKKTPHVVKKCIGQCASLTKVEIYEVSIFHMGKEQPMYENAIDQWAHQTSSKSPFFIHRKGAAMYKYDWPGDIKRQLQSCFIHVGGNLHVWENAIVSVERKWSEISVNDLRFIGILPLSWLGAKSRLIVYLF
jgi:hypothetical protein